MLALRDLTNLEACAIFGAILTHIIPNIETVDSFCEILRTTWKDNGDIHEIPRNRTEH